MAPRLQAWIDDGFARFQRAVSADEAPSAHGLASAVRGFSLLQLQPDAKARAKAAQQFEQARALMPEYSAARNLTAVTRPLRGDAPFDAAAMVRLERELVGAVALDPGDALTLGNLERVYRVFESRPALSPYSAGELKPRLAVVRSAQAEPAPTP